MKVYPSFRYHPIKGSKLVRSEAADLALGSEWAHSPAEFGVETEPGLEPDEAIAAKAIAAQKVELDVKGEAPRKPGRPKRLDPKEGVSA